MLEPYFTTARGVLFDVDCLDLLQALQDDSIDCVFADPPFNLSKKYRNGFRDSLPQERYMEWCRQWLQECSRVLKPGGAIFVYATPELAIQFGSLLNSLLSFRHWIAVSMKSTFSRGNKLYPAHYALLYYSKGQPRKFNRVRVPIPTCRHCGKDIKDYGGHRAKLNPAGLNLTDFWEDTSPNRHSKTKVRLGVNELKITIPERAMLIATDEDDIVLDPFGGGGVTYQAAEANNRCWIGSELYDFENIRVRFLNQFPSSVGQKPTFYIDRLFKGNGGYLESDLMTRRTNHKEK